MRRTTLRLGTRGSPLALAQTQIVLSKLREIHPNLKVVPVVIKTTGDRIRDIRRLRTAGKGVFVKEIERALLARRIDGAVHSLKDVPGDLPPGLVLGAILEREEAADAYVGRTSTSPGALPRGSVIGTASLRRRAFLLAAWPHLKIEDLRGNLDSRLARLRNPRSKLSGIVVAAAGLRRLETARGLEFVALPKETFVPAPGQGALAVEIREKDDAVRKLLAPLHHEATAAAVEAERDLMRRLEGGCQIPLGAHAQVSEDGLVKLTAALALPDGGGLIRVEATGAADSPRDVAAAVETMLRSRGADELLTRLRPGRRIAGRDGQARRRRAKARR